jgi:hypothetical protein
MIIQSAPAIPIFGLMLIYSVAADVVRKPQTTACAERVVEVLDNDRLHFETAAGSGPAGLHSRYTTAMVFKTDYLGPSSFVETGNTLEITAMRRDVNTSNPCVSMCDKTRG